VGGGWSVVVVGTDGDFDFESNPINLFLPNKNFSFIIL